MASETKQDFHNPKNLQKEFVLVSLFVLFGYGTGALLHWFNRFYPLDMLVHFAGGIWAALLALSLYPRLWLGFPEKKIFIRSLAFTALFVGICWELFEAVVDRSWITGFWGGPLDTLSDIFMDVLGGIAAALYILRRRD